MFQWLKNLFQPKQCGICRKKATAYRPYYNDQHEPILVCHLCVEYAERRAYRKR